MCTRYISPETAAIEREWHVGRQKPWKGKADPIDVFPGYEAPFIRRAKDSIEPVRELVVGQWNLIPWFAKEPKLKYATCNARSEELLDKAIENADAIIYPDGVRIDDKKDLCEAVWRMSVIGHYRLFIEVRF